MSKIKNPHIGFTTTKEFKEECEEYARSKGLVNASSFARFAMVAYMSKNPLKSKTRVSAAAAKNEETTE
jgi:hypothetical protein